MADYAPPTGPPPPHVPAGWKAVWNEQYKEWFYVNTYTKASTWEKPTTEAHPISGDAPPPGAPPAYDHNTGKPRPDEKSGFGSNNPYAGESDEAMARRLQQEEANRAQGSGTRGQSDSYYNSSGSGQQYGSGPSGAQSSSNQPEEKRGFFSKLSGKMGGSSQGRPPQQGYGQQGYGQQGYGHPPPGQYGGYPPQQGYGGYPQQGYQQYPPPGQPQYYQQAPPKKSGMGGMGALGGAGLGLGAGLLGGALIGDAIGHDGGDDGGYGGDDGGGYGGDDGGFGGDDGGGDGGGDF